MNTAPLIPSIESVFYELQALRKIYESLVANHMTNSAEIEKLLKRQDKVDTILITGNGEPSLREQTRVVNKKLDDLIEDIKSERKIRKDSEDIEKKKREEWNSRWFWSFVGIMLPAAFSFTVYLVIHLVNSLP